MQSRMSEQEAAYEGLQRHYEEQMEEQRQAVDRIQANYAEECRAFEAELMKL